MRPLGRGRTRGFVLLPVALAVALVAAVAFLLNREGAMETDASAGELEADVARFVAEAGFHHALWVARKVGCGGAGGPPPLVGVPFGAHAYSASFAPLASNRLRIASTGVLASGLTRTVTRNVVVSNAPTVLLAQPGAATGKDTYLDDGQPSQNFGSATRVRVTSKTNAKDHALFRFDLASVPANAEILSAELELNLESIGSANSGTVSVHRVTRDWSESGATWLQANPGISWSSPGGDYDPVPRASALVDHLAPGPTKWNLTQLVQRWVQAAWPNLGLMLRAGTGLNHTDFTASDHASPALHPKLTVTYRCPCDVSCVAATGIYRDELTELSCDPAVDFAGTNGTLDWSGQSWEEIGESNGPCSGAVRVVAHLGGNALRFEGDQRGVRRRVDLSSFGVARLVFDYMRLDFDDPSDALVVEVSANGGASWNEVGRITGPGTEFAYKTAAYDISAYATSESGVRFVTSGLGGSGSGTDFVFVDNVQIDRESVGGGGSTLTLRAVADTRIEENAPDSNYGAESRLIVGLDSGFKHYRSLLRFDVSTLPPAATVTSARLRLYVESFFGSKSVPTNAHRLTAAWLENTATWSNTGGGAFDPALLAATDVPSGTGWAEWTLPPALIHEWRDGVTPNLGVLLLPASDARKNNRLHPASREHATAAWRPELVLQYTEP